MHQGTFQFYCAFDGLPIRYGRWPCKQVASRGTVVVLGGRTEFMEKYLETVAELNQRGFDVFSLDWRGQGLSGRMLKNHRKGYVRTYADYVNDLDQLINSVVLPNGSPPLILLAHSMGGTIALHYLGRFGRVIDRAVLSAPLIRIKTLRHTEILGRWLSRRMTQFGMGHLAIPSLGRRHTFQGPFENNGLTSDPQRFREIQRMVTENHQLAIDGVTFGWLNATFDAIDKIHGNGVVRQITAPVLLAVAEKDSVVCNRAIHQFAPSMPNHGLTIIQGACHEILQEKETMRLQFWSAFDAFVE